MQAILAFLIARLTERSTLIGLVQVVAGALGLALTQQDALAIALILGGLAHSLVPDGRVAIVEPGQ